MALSRGIRNNNPLNIRHSADAWEGKSANQSDISFVRFDTPEAGIRAGVKNLLSYRDRHGLNTVEGIVGRWAPPTENHTAGYTAQVSEWTGFDPRTPLDLDDEEQMLSLVKAMAHKENGQVPYDDETFRRGIRAAKGQEALPALDPEAARALALQIEEEDRQRGPIMFGDSNPNDPTTRDEVDAIAAEMTLQTPDFIEGAGLAIGQEWGFLWAAGAERFAPDPQWSPSEEFIKQELAHLPREHWEFVAKDTTSEAQFQHRKALLETDLKAQEKLSRMGWTGTALQLGAAIIDPVALGIGIGSDGLAAPFVGGLKASRLARIMASAGTAAVGNTAAEMIPYTYKPTHSALDLLYAAAGGATLGGVVGAVARNRHTVEEAAALGKAGRAVIDAAEAEAASRLGIDGHLKHASAAEASYREALRTDTFDLVRDLDAETAPETAYGRLRWDAVGQAKSSENPLTRLLGGNLAEDAVGNADRNIATAYGATEWQHRQARVFDTRWSQVREVAFTEWADSQKLSVLQKQTARGAFYDEVTRYVRNTDPAEQFDPAVQKLGDHYRSLVKQLKDLANNPGAPEGRVLRPVQGFGGVVDDPNYVTRSFDHRRIASWRPGSETRTSAS